MNRKAITQPADQIGASRAHVLVLAILGARRDPQLVADRTRGDVRPAALTELGVAEAEWSGAPV